jgi:hypothetical protein
MESDIEGLPARWAAYAARRMSTAVTPEEHLEAAALMWMADRPLVNLVALLVALQSDLQPRVAP